MDDNIDEKSFEDEEDEEEDENKNKNKNYQLIDPLSEHTYNKQYIYTQILSRLNLYDDENHWVWIGMALRNESKPKDELFDIWNKWSRQSKTKYEGTVKTKKNGMDFI